MAGNNFRIPDRDEDLLEVSDNCYVSEIVDDADEIDQALNRFQAHVSGGEFDRLPEFFNAFFAVARHNDNINLDQRVRLFDSLCKGLNNFLTALRSHVSEMMNADALTEELTELNVKYANCLLMYIYLLGRISYHLETYTVKTTLPEHNACFEFKIARELAEVVVTLFFIMKAMNTTSKPGAGADVDTSSDFTVSFWNSCDGRLLLLRLIYGVITLDAASTTGAFTKAGIKFLWTPNVIDEQLINCIMKMITKFLENPDVCKANGKNILLAVFHVIRALCIGWDQSRAIAKQLMELAPHLAFFSQQGVTHFPFIDVIPLVQVKDEMEPMLTAMIAYVGNLDADTIASKDGDASARVFSLLIASLSERFPRLLFKNVAHIVPFLSFDPPSLRNSVLTAFTEIVLKCFNETDSFNYANLIKQKSTMLYRLQDHITDASALVRTRALNLWTKLALKCAIPMENFRFLLVRVVGDRLMDQSIMVRKAAVTLLTTLLSHNVFSSNLSIELGLCELNELRKKQSELLVNNPEQQAIEKVNKSFDSIEANVQEIMKVALGEFLISDQLPTTESVARRTSSIGALNAGERISGSRFSMFSQNKPQDVLDAYNIALLITENDTRVEGCLEFLRLSMKRHPDMFPRDMDMNEVVASLSLKVRELLLQQGVAHKMRDDDEVLLDEDRNAKYEQQISELNAAIEKIMDKLLFVTEMEKCMSKATYCAKFGQISEMSEMINFVCECNKFRIRGAAAELKKIFHLIWRKDNATVELIIHAGYEALYSKNPNPTIAHARTATNLMTVMADASDEDRVSLVETFVKLFGTHPLADETIDVFWKVAERQNERPTQRVTATRLLAIIARSQTARIRPELARLTRMYRTRDQAMRIEVLRVIVSMISAESKDDSEAVTFRVPSSDKLIKSMFAFLISDLSSEQQTLWMPHCREVVNIVYGICCRPYTIISSFFSKITQVVKRYLHQYNFLIIELDKAVTRLEELKSQNWMRVAETNNLAAASSSPPHIDGDADDEARERVSQAAIVDLEAEQKAVRMRVKYLRRLADILRARWQLGASRLLYFVGEVTLKFLTYLEVVFTNEIKADLQMIHEVRLMGAEERSSLELVEFDFDRDTPLIQFEKDSIRQRGFFEKADREDDRIGLTAISEEEKLQLKLQKILDRDTFSTSTINGRILPFVVLILKGHAFIGESLKEAAIACLAKLMLVNRKCCNRFLPLFFNFYESASVRLRNNMIILMTDLCFRFPNTFNKFNDEYIKKIHDENSGIRYTCLLVLSHMLLNDLIKVSGRIADLAPCLCDEDKRISLLARGFFTEISKKHNVLYNMMPDIISKLTTNRELSMKKFEQVIRFLFQFIVKDQHRETLIEKICQRFQLFKIHHSGGHASLPEALAYCVTQIPLNERCFRRLADGLRFYQEFLRNPAVYRHFVTALTAFKKTAAKSFDLRAQVEEFKQNLKKYQGDDSS